MSACWIGSIYIHVVIDGVLYYKYTVGNCLTSDWCFFEKKRLERLLQSEEAVKTRERTFALALQRVLGQVMDGNVLAMAVFQYQVIMG